ncbi:hypothetical protein P8452_77875 [Trifolium repens]|nr:hypothetical protein P8452_77875 [Trifolium repens]
MPFHLLLLLLMWFEFNHQSSPTNPPTQQIYQEGEIYSFIYMKLGILNNWELRFFFKFETQEFNCCLGFKV